MLITTAATTAKAGFVVLMGFCSLVSGECGLVGSHPDKSLTFKTRAECVKAALALDADVKKQTAVLRGGSSSPGPWTAHAVCGTTKDALIIAAALRAWAAAKLQSEQAQEEPTEAPGDRDPFPHGG